MQSFLDTWCTSKLQKLQAQAAAGREQPPIRREKEKKEEEAETSYAVEPIKPKVAPLDLTPCKPKGVQPTPRADSTMPFGQPSHRAGVTISGGPLSRRTPRSSRTPQSSRTLSNTCGVFVAPTSVRIGVDSTTFAHAVVAGVFREEELPDEREVRSHTAAPTLD